MDKKNINTLKKSVLATLAYYSALKTPLTLVQAGRYMVSTKYKACPVFRHGVQSPKLSEIRDILDELVKEGIATEQKGLYWLKSCSLKHVTCNMTKQIKTSVEKKSSYMKFIQWEKISQRKINLVRKALKIFRFVPGLRGLFVCGSVARKTSRRRSDIDFLILTDKNRVWTVRFFMTAIAFLLGKKTKNKKIVFSSPAYRPPACASPKALARRASEAGTDRQFPVPRKNRRDKFCLNHYRSTAKLKLEPELQDLYSAEEYAGMINFYSDGNIENQFYSANKDWMAKFLPNFDFVKPALRPRTEDGRRQTALYGLHPAICSLQYFLEYLLRELQKYQIIKSSRRFSGLDNRRIVSDNEVIMFHLNPRAPGVLNRYKRSYHK